MGNFCGKDSADDISSYWCSYSTLVEERSIEYVDLMITKKLFQNDFEHQQVVLSALVMGVKLSLIWETVYEQLVVPKLCPEPREQAARYEKFLSYEQDLSSVKNVFEKFLNKNLKEEDHEILTQNAQLMLKKMKAFNEERRELMCPHNIHNLPKNVEKELFKNVVHRVDLLKQCQTISLKHYSLLTNMSNENDFNTIPEY